MPALCRRRGVLRWKGIVKKDGKDYKTKWFGPGKQGGEEYKKALLWEKETEKEVEEERKRQEEQAARETPTASLTIREWVNDYLSDVKRRHTKRTYVEKKLVFKRLAAHIDPDSPVGSLTKKTALRFLQEQYDNRSGNAANRDRKNLLAAWSWGAKFLDGFPQHPNPFKAFDKFPEHRLDRYVPPEEDFWKVYHQTEPYSQDRIMLTAFLHLAARRGEIFRLRWADLDWSNGQVRLFTRKTKDGSWESAWLPMTTELKEALLYWWENRTHKRSEYVFTVTGEHNFDNQFEGQPFKERRHFMPRLCRKAKVKPFGFHAIRHLSAVILYHSGYNIAIIQKILRHKNATTTELYLKRLGLDPLKLQEAVNVFENRGQGKVLPFDPNQKEKAPEGSASEAF